MWCGFIPCCNHDVVSTGVSTVYSTHHLENNVLNYIYLKTPGQVKKKLKPLKWHSSCSASDSVDTVYLVKCARLD